jgi:hypothetical protein
MPAELWIRGPVGMDAERRVTRTGCLNVLVLLPTMTAGTRLLDLLQLLEGDHRIQVVFTVPEAGESWYGVDDFARAHGRMVIPWQQALQSRYELVLAASYAELERVRGPVLVLPHGASSLMSRKFSRSGGPTALPHTGLARETLTHRGRVIPSVLALTHDQELVVLRGSCPEALPSAVVVGDICLDRLVASQPFRANYRRALGVADDQRLVVVSSTWAPESTFGQHPELCRRLLSELPRSRHRVALVLHPSVWAVHSPWQIHMWLARCMREGLLVIPPDEGWRATVIASDWVIGDHGSTTQYAAAIGRPVVLSAFPVHVIRSGSIADTVASAAPMLDLGRPLLDQLRVAEHATERTGATAGLITSRPGRAAATLRRAMYELLGLAEPDHPAETRPVPLPRPLPSAADHREEIA